MKTALNRFVISCRIDSLARISQMHCLGPYMVSRLHCYNFININILQDGIFMMKCCEVHDTSSLLPIEFASCRTRWYICNPHINSCVDQYKAGIILTMFLPCDCLKLFALCVDNAQYLTYTMDETSFHPEQEIKHEISELSSMFNTINYYTSLYYLLPLLKICSESYKVPWD